MNALDKIKKEILKQAGAKADEILDEASNKAAKIRETGQANQAELNLLFEKNTEQECLEIIQRSDSADRQKRRHALLETRNQIVDDVIAEAEEKILNLPDKEYTDFLFHLFEKNAQPLDGIIHLSPKDYARIPSGFLKRCKQIFPDHALELSGDIENINHGFVIQYGNILQNCSIESIFESETQILRDKAHEILAVDA